MNRFVDYATGFFLLLSFYLVLVWVKAFDKPDWLPEDREATYAVVCVVAALVGFAYAIGRRVKENKKEPKLLSAPPQNLATHAIGRSKDVKKIFVQLMQSKQPLVVTGIGGLGKTTVVQLIWQQYKNKFDHVAYLTANALFTDNKAYEADNAEQFLKAFTNNEDLLTHLNIKFDETDDFLTRFKKVITALIQVEGRNLLVIDNASNAAAMYVEHLSRLPNWKILLTSRDAITNMAHLELGTLSTDDAVRLFRRIYTKPVGQDELTNILRGVNLHTLAIELIAAYAREKNLTIPQLEEQIEERGLRDMTQYNVTTVRDGRRMSVVEHLLLTFAMDLSDSEKEIMRYFSVLPAEGTGIDEKLMTEDQLAIYFQKEDKKADLHNTLSVLARLNWLKKEGEAYLCHPIVKEMAYIQLKPNAVNCEKLIVAFNDLLYVDPFSNDHILNRRHFEPFAAEILRGCYDADTQPIEADKVLVTLVDGLRRLHWYNGSYYTALKYGEINLALSESIFSADHLEVASSLSNLAMIYKDLGDLPMAKREMEKAIVIEEAQLDPQHLRLATLYSNLATIYRNLGDLPMAKREMEKAIVIEEAQLDPQHLSLATLYSNLALIYQDLGDLPRAKAEMEKAITIQEVQLNPQHLSLATRYSNLATIYRALGDLPRAKAEMEKAITIFEAQLDPQHLNLATSYSNLALIYQDLGDLPRAKTEMEKTIVIQEAQLDPQHLSLATLYNNLAYILADMQALPLAKTYMDKAVTIWQLRLPPEHPHLLDSLETQQAWAAILSERTP